MPGTSSKMRHKKRDFLEKCQNFPKNIFPKYGHFKAEYLNWARYGQNEFLADFRPIFDAPQGRPSGTIVSSCAHKVQNCPLNRMRPLRAPEYLNWARYRQNEVFGPIFDVGFGAHLGLHRAEEASKKTAEIGPKTLKLRENSFPNYLEA